MTHPSRIVDRDTLEIHLENLVAIDPGLAALWSRVGEVPVRKGAEGFAGLAQIVNSQLLSVASARAIHGRFAAHLGTVTAERFLACEQADIRACGLSAGKYRTLRGIAEAERAGTLDYAALGHMPVDEAMAALTRLDGVGPWTAEIYLLLCLGHADIFPAGDLALRKMVGYALGADAVPDVARTRALAARWAPHRGAAARLLWRGFAVWKNAEGIGL